MGDGYIMLADGDAEPSYFDPMGASDPAPGASWGLSPAPPQGVPDAYFTPMVVSAVPSTSPMSNVYATPVPVRPLGSSEDPSEDL